MFIYITVTVCVFRRCGETCVVGNTDNNIDDDNNNKKKLIKKKVNVQRSKGKHKDVQEREYLCYEEGEPMTFQRGESIGVAERTSVCDMNIIRQGLSNNQLVEYDRCTKRFVSKKLMN